MKTDIHPPYHESTSVTCACGNSFTVGSTSSEISVEVCSNCHPFYTGKSKLVDAAGRVDKFQQRLKETAAKQKARATAKKTTHTKKAPKSRKKSAKKTVKLS
jgi:large subunit ribosomal protein L31